MKRMKMIAFFLLAAIGCLVAVNTYIQQSSPASHYYHKHIATQAPQAQAPSAALPSQSYYKSTLRSGSEWDEEDNGPGGGGDGYNQGVGVAIATPGLSSLVACIVAYGIFVCIKRRRNV